MQRDLLMHVRDLRIADSALRASEGETGLGGGAHQARVHLAPDAAYSSCSCDSGHLSHLEHCCDLSSVADRKRSHTLLSEGTSSFLTVSNARNAISCKSTILLGGKCTLASCGTSAVSLSRSVFNAKPTTLIASWLKISRTHSLTFCAYSAASHEEPATAEAAAAAAVVGEDAFYRKYSAALQSTTKTLPKTDI
jgi:hypothetical protein